MFSISRPQEVDQLACSARRSIVDSINNLLFSIPMAADSMNISNKEEFDQILVDALKSPEDFDRFLSNITQKFPNNEGLQNAVKAWTSISTVRLSKESDEGCTQHLDVPEWHATPTVASYATIAAQVQDRGTLEAVPWDNFSESLEWAHFDTPDEEKSEYSRSEEVLRAINAGPVSAGSKLKIPSNLKGLDKNVYKAIQITSNALRIKVFEEGEIPLAHGDPWKDLRTVLDSIQDEKFRTAYGMSFAVYTFLGECIGKLPGKNALGCKEPTLMNTIGWVLSLILGTYTEKIEGIPYSAQTKFWQAGPREKAFTQNRLATFMGAKSARDFIGTFEVLFRKTLEECFSKRDKNLIAMCEEYKFRFAATPSGLFSHCCRSEKVEVVQKIGDVPVKVMTQNYLKPTIKTKIVGTESEREIVAHFNKALSGLEKTLLPTLVESKKPIQKWVRDAELTVDRLDSRLIPVNSLIEGRLNHVRNRVRENRRAMTPPKDLRSKPTPTEWTKAVTDLKPGGQAEHPAFKVGALIDELNDLVDFEKGHGWSLPAEVLETPVNEIAQWLYYLAHPDMDWDDVPTNLVEKQLVVRKGGPPTKRVLAKAKTGAPASGPANLRLKKTK